MAYLAILKMFSLGANQCSQSSYTLCFCKYIDTIVNTVKPRTDKQVFLDKFYLPVRVYRSRQLFDNENVCLAIKFSLSSNCTVIYIRWPTSVTAKVNSHSKIKLTRGKIKLTRGKIKLTHGKIMLTHSKIKLTYGKIKLTK
jgi:hypothetical protein